MTADSQGDVPEFHFLGVRQYFYNNCFIVTNCIIVTNRYNNRDQITCQLGE